MTTTAILNALSKESPVIIIPRDIFESPDWSEKETKVSTSGWPTRLRRPGDFPRRPLPALLLWGPAMHRQ